MITATAVHPLIAERRSPRAFSPQSVPREELEAMLEAARWAPSSMNEQPWFFVVADKFADPQAHAALVSTLMAPNAAWATQAPVLILAGARSTFSRNGAPNAYAWYDTGAAVLQLVLQAQSAGVAAHQMGGFSKDAARAAAQLPEGFDPVTMIALGYPGDVAELPEPLRSRENAPRTRREISDWAFAGSFGQPLEF
jgi:nitroreductase